MPKLNKTLHTKKRLLEALEKSLGVVTIACKEVDVTRTTFYNYLESDTEFAAAVEQIGDVALDFAESQLFKQIKEGNPASTIFYLKTKGKKRGYIERQELIAEVRTFADLAVEAEKELDERTR